MSDNKGSSIKLVRVIEVTSIIFFPLAISYLLFCYVRAGVNVNVLLLLPIIYIAAALVADFVSGLIHFLGDNLTVKNQTLYNIFIHNFIAHHDDQTAMVQHDFAETNGLNALGSSITLAPYLFLPLPSTPLSEALFIFICLFTLLIFFTNQIHKYAHMAQPPKLIKGLQKLQLILRPQNHYLHHHHLDRHYCITNGWLNRLCYKTQLFERLSGIKKPPHLNEPSQK